MFDFLKPISENLIDFISGLPDYTIGKQALVHRKGRFPELNSGAIVVYSIVENRNDAQKREYSLNFDSVRKEFYKLVKGNWDLEIVDLGEIIAGETIEDTYFAVKELVRFLIEEKCIPIALGGSQDLVFAQYRAYDPNNGMINLVNVDAQFDFGNVDKPISNLSFVGKIIVEKPYNLFNYTNFGFQSYFVPSEELDLLSKMFFEGYRLGEVVSDVSMVEPIFRDADLVSIDLNVISSAYYGESPNGFSGREICALARYAGISDKVSSFGIFEYNSDISKHSGNQLVAQLMWYFIEGVSCRWGESGKLDSMDVIHYQVPIEDDILSFYKSRLTERWWMEISYSNALHNNLKSYALLPCTYADYEEACNQNLPNRWYNAKMKYEI